MSRTDLQTLPERAVALLGGEPDDTTLRRYLHGLPGVDAVGLEQRAAGLGTRSIKTRRPDSCAIATNRSACANVPKSGWMSR